MPPYDVIIIGSGPSGLTAAIYATRANLKTLVIAGQVAGGQLTTTTEVENYPGFPNGVLGPDLMNLWRKQAERFNAEIIDDNVTRVDFKKRPFKVWVEAQEYQGRTVIIATGANAKYLDLPNEQRLKGRGVSACATCLPSGSTVVANAAPVAIESVVEGQKVLTDDGTFQPVAGVGSRHYEGDLVRIVPRYFQEEPTLLTPEHPVLATTVNKGTGASYWRWTWREPDWIPAGDLTPEHILLYPIVSETRDVQSIRLSELLGLARDESGRVFLGHAPAGSRRLTDDVPLDDGFMRLAGYFLADGSVGGSGITLSFGPQDHEWVVDALSSIERLFGYPAKLRHVGHVYRVECYSRILRDLFLKLFGKYSYTKSAPHWFLYLPSTKQEELLKGYWRGDGGVRPQGFTLVSNSPKLVAQLKMMLLRSGILPRVSRRSAKSLNRTRSAISGRRIRFRHERYELEIGGTSLKRASDVFGLDHPLLLRRTRSHAHAWLREGYAYLPIHSLSRVRFSGRVHNLAVESRNSYVTAGAILHNCDGFFFKQLDVVVVGGGDTAMEEALYLAKLCKTVTVVHRRHAFRASKIMQDRLLKAPNVKVVWDSEVVDVLGVNKVEAVRLKNAKTGEETDLKAQGLFLAIGHTPATEIFKGQVDLDKDYIVLRTHDGYQTSTSVEGVFAAGDVHDHRYRQAVTAAGFGCMAALDAEKWLQAHE